ncbi:MAG: UDP-3-O-acyl-N-acetylglucosamine deacetylase [Candidatus Omnitrophica bacterium]|nr:UDP-3-O-acyl-N-acetylglucosamine deacetylase [Candidatus Omnitrophota bacterium]
MIKQRTIKKEVAVEGIGLQTGKKVKLTLKGSPADSGINFIRVDLPNKPLLSVGSLKLDAGSLKERRTTLGTGPLQIQTTEHLLAAFSGLGIDNIIAELDGEELPGLDGSAKDYVSLLKKAGIVEQDAPKNILKVDRAVWHEDEKGFIAVFPDDRFRISYTLAYDGSAIGVQFFDMVVEEDSFEREIAPARTFCRKTEALVLLASGLGKGANYKNTLVMGRKGPLKNRLRFTNEPVRHKVLDLMGDLYILGKRMHGHVVAMKSGHKLNMELVRKLKEI